MKILKLRFRNINSLYGEWSIDFQDPEYTRKGLFALTGPTGSGKTTVLDAIGLALYAQTPRQGKITKSQNEIMSRQAGDCFAEIIFETNSHRYRCFWSQKRAGNRIDGNLQDPVHKIFDADSDQTIESKSSETVRFIKQITGMDFDQFTNASLLAQGDFDLFLAAKFDQKSRILEDITGGGIYREISKEVFERTKSERNILLNIQNDLNGILCLDPNQEKDLLDEIEKVKMEVSQWEKSEEEINRMMIWREKLDSLEKDLDHLEKRNSDWIEKNKRFEPDRLKLSLAKKIGHLEGSYGILISQRESLENDRSDLKLEKENLPQKEDQYNLSKADLILATDSLDSAKKNKESEMILIRDILSLDHLIKAKKENYESTSQKIESLEKEIIIRKDLRDAKNQDRIQILNSKDILLQDLKDHESDAQLIPLFSGIESDLINLNKKQAEIDKIHNQISEKENQRINSGEQKKILSQKIEDLEKKKSILIAERDRSINDREILLDGKLRREYETEKETLHRERLFHKTIADLKTERHKLKDGKPCPLCGSLDHPYASGDLPMPDETEQKIDLIDRLLQKENDLSEMIEQFGKDLGKMEKDIHEIKLEENTLDAKIKAVGEMIAQEITEQNRRKEEFDHSKSKLINTLLPFGISDFSDEEIPSIINDLRLRLENWNRWIGEKQIFETRLKEIISAIGTLDMEISFMEKDLEKRKKDFQSERTEYEELCRKRMERFGEKIPSEEEKSLDENILKAEEAKERCLIRLNEYRDIFNETTTKIQSLGKRIGELEEKLKEREAQLLKECRIAGFPDLESLHKAFQLLDIKDELEKKFEEFDKQKTSIDTLLTKAKEDRETEAKKFLTNKSAYDLKKDQDQIRKEKENRVNTLGELKVKIRDNTINKEKAANKLAELNRQTSIVEKWEKLNSLIGEKTGNKFASFVQGITFTKVVDLANEQLGIMTDRYRLQTDPEDPLGLKIVDYYQAENIRPTTNLSGGEKFLVSLALALGLSNLSSRKTNVDSLFLDEGFGALDDDKLDTALNALDKIQQGGKLIGVISHVKALQERIGTQIQVTTKSGGRSKLSGPGVGQIKIESKKNLSSRKNRKKTDP